MIAVKVGKLPIITSFTCNFISELLGKKYGGFFLNCTKFPLIILCRKFLLRVDFKKEFDCKPEESKQNFI